MMPDSALPPPAGSTLNDLRRHWLVWLAPEFHGMVSDQVTNPMLRQFATDFLAAGGPLVIPSQANGNAGHSLTSTSIAVGMPLPPSQGKHRLAFTVPPQSIVRAAPPMRLADAIPGLAKQWRAPLRQLQDDARAIGLEFRVFGSVAWESLTGRGYLTSESDIDLLWRPSDYSQIVDGIALLTAWEARTGPGVLRVDGELTFGDDLAVAWREWRAVQQPRAARRVLVKTLQGPRVCLPSELLAGMPRSGTATAGAMACA